MKKNKKVSMVVFTLILLWVPGYAVAEGTLRLSRDECVKIALENNRMCRISEYEIRIAEAMLNQAKSAYWPTLSAGLTAGILDDPLVFTYPASSINLPPLLGGGTIPIEQQKVEIMDDKVLVGSLNFKYALYAGGKIKAVNDQAKFGVEAARQGTRRTELEVVRDIDRAYYGTVMARKLVKISDDTLQRMEATLDLTKRLYEEGSGTVKKTDYLRNKTTVEMIRSVKSQVKLQQVKADTALVNLMGMDYGTVVEPTLTELPRRQETPESMELIQLAFIGNPDLARVRAGMGVAEARIRAARSNYKPKVGLFAKYIHIENESDTGMMDPQNKDLGMIGIGAELPLFEGFLNKNRVIETKLELEKLKLQEEALTQGIALKIQHAYSELESANERESSTGEGLKAATENRELNIRAYQEELVETADVIQAQIMEAFLDASYQKILYECIEARAKLSFLVGSETKTSAPTDQ